MKKIKWILGIALVGSLVSLMSCGAIAAALAAPQGYVYNGRTGAAIANVTVQLKDFDGNVLKSATTNNNGYYSFLDVDYGKFELTATVTGYTFIKQIVEVSGVAQVLPNIAGLANDFDGDGTDDLVTGVLSIVTFWNRDFQDVDAHLTFPNANVGTVGFAEDGSDFYTPDSAEDNASPGFFPDTLTSRFQVPIDDDIYPTTQTTKDSNLTTGGDIWLDVDNVGYVTQSEGGPETITVYYPPTDISTTFDTGRNYQSTGSGDVSGLPAADGAHDQYTGIGVMEFYLDAWNGTVEPSSAAGGAQQVGAKLTATDNNNVAAPVVYVFDGTNQIARYRLPQYTNMERASIFRVNIFVQETSGNIYYQILPDIKVLADDGAGYANIKSASSASAPIVVKARSRQ